MLGRLGRSEYFADIHMLCYMVPSHTNTHTVRGRPTAKKEIRRFRNGLVCERKVNERKLLRRSKTLIMLKLTTSVCTKWRLHKLHGELKRVKRFG